MRYLIFFILLFLLIRLISHAFINRPSVSGPRKTRNTPRGGKAENRSASPKSFENVEDAEFEEIEENRKKESS